MARGAPRRTAGEIVLSPHRRRAATRLKLELDLVAGGRCRAAPPRRGCVIPNGTGASAPIERTYCRVFVRPLSEQSADWHPSPETLRRIRRVRRQFEAFRPRRETMRAQIDGDELDLDALVRARADFAAGGEAIGPHLYFGSRAERAISPSRSWSTPRCRRKPWSGPSRDRYRARSRRCCSATRWTQAATRMRSIRSPRRAATTCASTS